ncbi:hypothetical protein niasHS_005920 [Heterodera schachtii]|uniref:Uncharacterized protein n=1 Tax=Heterodera schachtii TaxID=97005 RepID=A0ABD2JMV7_HETSC
MNYALMKNNSSRKGNILHKLQRSILLPLHAAARSGALSACKLLVAMGADANCRSLRGITPLMEAAAGGHLNIVEFCVEICKANVNFADSNGTTALIRASVKGKTDVVCYLIAMGARLDQVDNKGYTAFLFTAQKGLLIVCEMLAENGANANLKTASGTTPLMAASEGGHSAIVKFLVDKCQVKVEMADANGNSALLCALIAKNDGIASYLIKKGARVDRANNDGFSPLHAAVNLGNLQLCQLIVKKGANVNQQTSNGKTPLMLAVYARNSEIVKFLVEEAGADTQIKDSRGFCALIIAFRHIVHCQQTFGRRYCTQKDRQIVRFLVEKSDSPAADQQHQKDNCAVGRSPLHYAAKLGYLDVCQLLVAKGADVNQMRMMNEWASFGKTPLMEACTNGHFEIVKFLVEQGGADIEIANKVGNASKWAAMCGKTYIVCYFDAIIDTRQQNGNGTKAKKEEKKKKGEEKEEKAKEKGEEEKGEKENEGWKEEENNGWKEEENNGWKEEENNGWKEEENNGWKEEEKEEQKEEEEEVPCYYDEEEELEEEKEDEYEQQRYDW